MTQDFKRIPGITATAIGTAGDEPTFSFPEILNVIKLCSANDIAVLGVEFFLTKPDGYHALGCSTYDLQQEKGWQLMQHSQWCEYVRRNNALAEEFVRQNPLGDDHVYLLTAASWAEFQEIQKSKRAGGAGAPD